MKLYGFLVAAALFSAAGMSQTGSGGAKASPAVPDAPVPQTNTSQGKLKKLPSAVTKLSDLKPPELPKPLSVSASKRLQVPVFSSYGETLCDADGNMFFHVAAGTYGTSPILEISSDGERSTTYDVSGNTDDSPSFISFSVSPSSTVRELAESKSGVVILGFDSEGKTTSPTRLELPAHVSPQEFASFENGEAVFYGYYNKEAPEVLRGQRYVALFAPSGKLIKKISDPEHLDLDQFTKKLQSGAATLGSDGNIYLLRNSDVVVISQSGEVLRRLLFEKTPSDAVPTKIVYSGGLLAIFLSKSAEPFIMRRYLILDSLSGEQRGFYTPSKDTSNNDVCFSRKEGFTFLHNSKGTLYLISAELR